MPEGADAERVIRDLAQQGHKLIFTTSFGFMNPTLKVAEEFKDVKFEHATGYKTAPNVNTYNARFYEGRYLAGMIAGKMSKTGTLGYVGAFPIPEVLQGINAFVLGARATNPKAQLRVVWINTWYDPGKERDAANTLMAQGADVVTHHTDSTAVVAAAEEKRKMAVAYHSNMAKFGPNAQLVAVTHHWGDYYTQRTQAVLDGTWSVAPVWGGMREGFIRLQGLADNLPPELVEAVKARQDEIRARQVSSFHRADQDQRRQGNPGVGLAYRRTARRDELLRRRCHRQSAGRQIVTSCSARCSARSPPLRARSRPERRQCVSLPCGTRDCVE